MTSTQLYRYSLYMKSEWQHSGAFVIQFNDETDLAANKYEGRVEHIESGQAIRFYSIDELLIFLNQILGKVFE